MQNLGGGVRKDMEVGLAGRKKLLKWGVKKNTKLDPGLGGNSLKAVEVTVHFIPAGGLFLSQTVVGKTD